MTDLPKFSRLPKNWSNLITYLKANTTVASDQITFDGETIVKGPNGWTGSPDDDGGRRFIAKLSAAMYATGDISPYTASRAEDTLNTANVISSNKNNHALRDLLKVAFGYYEKGNRFTNVAGTNFDSTKLDPLTVGGRLGRFGLMLPQTANFGSMTEAQLVGYLRASSFNGDLRDGRDTVINSAINMNRKTKLVGQRFFDIVNSVVAKFDPWSMSVKIGNSYVSLYELKKSLGNVSDGLDGKYSLAGIEKFQDSGLSSGDQVRAQLIYNQIDSDTVNQYRIMAHIIGASGPTELVDAVKARMNPDQQSSASALLDNMTEAAGFMKTNADTWAGVPVPTFLDSWQMIRTKLQANDGSKIQRAPAGGDIKSPQEFFGDVQDIPSLAGSAAGLYEALIGEVPKGHYVLWHSTSDPTVEGQRFNAFYLLPNDGSPAAGIRTPDSLVVSKPNGFYRVLEDEASKKQALEAILAADSKRGLEASTDPTTKVELRDGDGQVSTISMSDLDLYGSDSDTPVDGDGTGDDGTDDGDGEGPVDGM